MISIHIHILKENKAFFINSFMGEIQLAYELAWFLCGIMGSKENQSSTRLSKSG